MARRGNARPIHAHLLTGTFAFCALVYSIFVYFHFGLNKIRQDWLYFAAPYLVLFSFARESYRWGRIMAKPSAEALLQSDHRAPVLYLRSFDTDSELFDWYGDDSLEAGIIGAFSSVGPVVAFHRPDETRLTENGAARFDLMVSNWQSDVRRVMKSAALIVLRAGDSPGLFWELETALAEVAKTRIVIMIPESVKKCGFFLQTLWNTDKRVVLPEFLNEAPMEYVRGIAYFKSDGTLVYKPLVSAPFWRNSFTIPLPPALMYALRPVCQQLGLPWHEPPFRWGAILRTPFFIVDLVVMCGMHVAMMLLVGPFWTRSRRRRVYDDFLWRFKIFFRSGSDGVDRALRHRMWSEDYLDTSDPPSVREPRE